ncbi:CDP-diacylglycerol-glycerol-3-phosphate 3-phosphatidyltransferase [Myxozyma melibiosi]|uniref:CDP-diacylglycerol--glycerol-3-phosphate 3-phosphatidyltransferase n=1 Tax=Myxozyma melibiosi TaxID=54550 RepID=A0ABR1F1Q9_9ASCO
MLALSRASSSFSRAGRVSARSGRSSIQRQRVLLHPHQQQSRRAMASASASAGGPSSSSSSPALLHPSLLALLDDLDKLSPRFYLSPGEIDILTTPADFYATLKSKILSARSHVFLATLYIGRTEHDLIDTLRTALQKNPDLQVHLLTDALRGTREAPHASCASLMASLAADFPDRVHVRLFHTPKLRGLAKAVTPVRLNEGWGLQHMKLYGFDDEIILSGANLSEDYFTNRQDRYYLFHSAEVTAYYRRIFEAVSALSYKLDSDASSPSQFKLSWSTDPSLTSAPEPTKHPNTFCKAATALIAPLLRPPASSTSSASSSSCITNKQVKTVFYPISQMTPLLRPNHSTEAPAVERMLDVLSGPDQFSWMFTAGYFNIHPTYRSKFLDSDPEKGIIITAAPEANGFYQSAGVSKYLPPAYTQLAHEFVKDVAARKKSEKIKLLEWQNGVLNQPGGWTYHAKGIWLTPPAETTPCVTVIGSSNFTRRSHTMDLESNGLIVTVDEDLRQKMKDETENLQKFTKVMEEKDFQAENRKVGLGVKLSLAVLGLAL